MLKIFLTDCLQEFWYLFCFLGFFSFSTVFLFITSKFHKYSCTEHTRPFAHEAWEKLDIRNCRERKNELRKNSCKLLRLRSESCRRNRREGYELFSFCVTESQAGLMHWKRAVLRTSDIV